MEGGKEGGREGGTEEERMIPAETATKERTRDRELSLSPSLPPLSANTKNTTLA